MLIVSCLHTADVELLFKKEMKQLSKTFSVDYDARSGSISNADVVISSNKWRKGIYLINNAFI